MSPEIKELLKNAAWENRRFVWRAVDYLARECGGIGIKDTSERSA